MKDLNEDEIINILSNKFGEYSKLESGIRDDVSMLKIGNGDLVAKVDMLVYKTDVPIGMKIWQIARKSIVACVSDFAAKGVQPTSVLLSLGLPRSLKRNDIIQLSLGFKRACKEFDLKIIGGDTNESDDLIIDCCMLGFSDKITTREGAMAGEKVIVSGSFGYPPLGLAILENGLEQKGSVIKRSIDSVYLPTPRLDLGLSFRQSNILSSSMDSSDGLGISLHQLADAGGVGFSISKLPVDNDLMRVAKLMNLDTDSLVLYGGEEYEIVATVNRDKISEAKRIARKFHTKLFEIGEVTDNTGKIVYDDGSRYFDIERKGWTHLS